MKIEVPTKWSAINLTTYLKLQEDLKIYKDDEQATFACLLNNLCGIEPTMIPLINNDIIFKINSDLTNFMINTECDLQKIIKINGKKYGFEPDLSTMSYGAYLDITSYGDITIDKNWNKIMSILYRPVVKLKRSGLYTIKPYTGNEDPNIFNEVGMDIHFGAIFFFINISKQLLENTLNCLIPKMLKLQPNLNTILEKNGVDIPQSLLSLMKK